MNIFKQADNKLLISAAMMLIFATAHTAGASSADVRSPLKAQHTTSDAKLAAELQRLDQFIKETDARRNIDRTRRWAERREQLIAHPAFQPAYEAIDRDVEARAQKRKDARQAGAETKAAIERADLLFRKRQAIANEIRLDRKLAPLTRGMAPVIPGINADPIPPAPAMQAAPAGTASDSKVAIEHLSEPREEEEEELSAAQTTKYLRAMRAGLAPDMSTSEDLVPQPILDQRRSDIRARRAALERFKLKPANGIAVGVFTAALADTGIIPPESPAFEDRLEKRKRTIKRSDLLPKRSIPADQPAGTVKPIKTKPAATKKSSASISAKKLAEQIGVSQRTAQWIKELGLATEAIENTRNKRTPFDNCTPQSSTKIICTAEECESRLFADYDSLLGHMRRSHHGNYNCNKCLKIFDTKEDFIADHFPKKRR